jgi:hypothetical protein
MQSCCRDLLYGLSFTFTQDRTGRVYLENILGFDHPRDQVERGRICRLHFLPLFRLFRKRCRESRPVAFAASMMRLGILGALFPPQGWPPSFKQKSQCRKMAHFYAALPNLARSISWRSFECILVPLAGHFFGIISGRESGRKTKVSKSVKPCESFVPERENDSVTFPDSTFALFAELLQKFRFSKATEISF